MTNITDGIREVYRTYNGMGSFGTWLNAYESEIERRGLQPISEDHHIAPVRRPFEQERAQFDIRTIGEKHIEPTEDDREYHEIAGDPGDPFWN